MTDNDQNPVHFDAWKLKDTPVYFDPWIRPYRGSGKSTMIKALTLKLIKQGVLDEQSDLLFSSEMLDAIADAVANQSRYDQFRPWHFHLPLPINAPTPYHNNFGLTTPVPGKDRVTVLDPAGEE